MASDGLALAMQVSPFEISPFLHDIGQTRSVSLAKSATRASLMSGLVILCPRLYL